MSKKTNIPTPSLERKYFSKIKDAIPLPDLIEVQHRSYDSCVKEGLRELFDEISPILDFTGRDLELQFLDYYLDEPRFDELTAKAKNVTFEAMGSSSIVKGEIKNNSVSDVTSASFIMKLFSKNGRMIAEFDFHIRKIASNTIKPFEETVRGVLPSQISRYEIKYRSSF